MQSGMRVLRWLAREENVGDADRNQDDDLRRETCRTPFWNCVTRLMQSYRQACRYDTCDIGLRRTWGQ